MPLLYGEGGNKAFERLQIQILEQIDDESILAWNLDESDLPGYATADIRYQGKDMMEKIAPCVITGIFARSPRYFLRSGSIAPATEWAPESPLRMSSRGVEMARKTRSEVRVTVQKLQFGGGPANRSGFRVLRVPLACRNTKSKEQCYIILVEDILTHFADRWARLILTEVEYNDFFPTERPVKGYWVTMHFFVCVNWPEERNLHHLRKRLLNPPKGIQPRDAGNIQ